MGLEGQQTTIQGGVHHREAPTHEVLTDVSRHGDAPTDDEEETFVCEEELSTRVGKATVWCPFHYRDGSGGAEGVITFALSNSGYWEFCSRHDPFHSIGLRVIPSHVLGK